MKIENNNSKEKNLLILSGPMGSGHERAAQALKEYTDVNYTDIKAKHINVEDYMSQLVKFIYSRVYIICNNYFPIVWGIVYKITNKPPGTYFWERIIYFIRHITSRRIVKMILKQQADYIICTHYLPAELLNRLKKKGRIRVPVSSVVTDFSLHWVYIQPHLDNFFVASEEVQFRLKEYGIPEDNIHISGIPVKSDFARDFSKKEILKMKKDLDLPLHDKIILLMMGGESKNKLIRLAKFLLERFPDKAFIVLAGKNEELLEKLEELKNDNPDQLFPLGFTNEVWRYMAVSNTVVSKPGGISMSECIAMRKPMIIMYPIPGQEEKNADYLLEKSIVSKAYDEISLAYKELLLSSDDKYFIKNMQWQLEKLRKPLASKDILDITLRNDTGSNEDKTKPQT